VNKTKNMPNKAKSKKIIFRNIAILFLSVILLVVGMGCVYADQLLGNINFVPDNSNASQVKTGNLFEPGVASNGAASAKSGVVGGLYHDDAITNILLLGVDDYQKNDPGRSDSMLLVSVDTRHNKLKLTSFMRDMYVAIPGHSSNKLNTAYHFAGGGVEGAKLAVKTIEANFGTDIDRYVIVSNSAFDQIIDKLGGVTMTITAAEAKLVNINSGDPRRNLTAGTFLLSGKQAHYYSRIRVIGDDFERTERQRKVFSSIVDKFKTSNIGTIYSVLSQTLHLVTTNMTKDEVVGMAGNSLTYLNYPISQNRIPGDNDYQSDTVSGVGMVLVPDLDVCRKSVADFIFQSDLPTKTYTAN
jgi:LCP family protein required for cell wall assembly